MWVRYQSAELGYQMDHPANWDVTHEPATEEWRAYDLFLGPIDGELQVYRWDETEIAGALANQWFRDSAALLSESLVSGPELTQMISRTNGLEAQIFIGEAEDASDPSATLFFQEAVVFGGDLAWDLDWYSQPGNESEDQQLMIKFVMSFERYAP